MQLSKRTLSVMRVLASINPNLLISPGKTLKSVNEAKSIFASAEVDDEFITEFAIYNLSDLLALIDLQGQEAKIDFSETQAIISRGNSKVTFKSAARSIVTSPQKDIKMPPADIVFSITKDQLADLRKASSLLDAPTLSITSNKPGTILIETVDPKNSAANTYSIEVEAKLVPESKFKYMILVSNLKLIPGDYDVELAAGKISKFTTNTDGFKTEIFVALEKDSTSA